MYDDAFSMFDLDFWAYENFECIVMMNVCCCSLNPRTLFKKTPMVMLFCC